MSKLTAHKRNNLPDSKFALPGRRFPIEDAPHARNALARASANATPSEQEMIRAEVRRRFPGIKVGGKK